MNNYTEIIDHLTDNPTRATLAILDEEGVELCRPLDGFFAVEKAGSRFNVWQYRPEVPSGVSGGAAFHFVEAVLIEADQVEGSAVMRGTWTGIRRVVVLSEDGVTGSLQYQLGERISFCRAVLTPRPE
jgi:hypothetical protein